MSAARAHLSGKHCDGHPAVCAPVAMGCARASRALRVQRPRERPAAACRKPAATRVIDPVRELVDDAHHSVDLTDQPRCGRDHALAFEFAAQPHHAAGHLDPHGRGVHRHTQRTLEDLVHDLQSHVGVRTQEHPQQIARTDDAHQPAHLVHERQPPGLVAHHHVDRLRQRRLRLDGQRRLAHQVRGDRIGRAHPPTARRQPPAFAAATVEGRGSRGARARAPARLAPTVG